MNLSPGYILMFLLSGGLVVWALAWWSEAFDEPQYLIAILGLLILGLAGSALSLLPLRNGEGARLRRLSQWQAEGLVSDEEAAAARRRILG